MGLQLHGRGTGAHLTLHALNLLLVHGEILLSEVLHARLVVIRFYHLLDAAGERSLSATLRLGLDHRLGTHLLLLRGATARRLVIPLVDVGSARRAGLGSRLRRLRHVRSRMNTRILVILLLLSLARAPLRINLRLRPLMERVARLSMRELRLRRRYMRITRNIRVAIATH